MAKTKKAEEEKTKSRVMPCGLVDPFDFNRLYGPEKYSLQNMLLKQVTYPAQIDLSVDKPYDGWSDHSREEFSVALAGIESTLSGDAFFNGIKDEDFLTFASKFFSLINKREIKLTGARAVRTTNNGGYPTITIDGVILVSNQKVFSGNSGPAVNRPKYDRYGHDRFSHLGLPLERGEEDW